MKLIINEKPHKVIATEGRRIRNIGDIYEPEHKQESNPQKESNDDKGNQESYKHVKPEKKPNAEPENLW